MNKVWTVIRAEYVTAVRSKGFVIGLILLPILMLGGVAVQHLARNKVDTRTRTFAVVDRSEQMFDALKRKAQERNRNQIYSAPGDGERRKIRSAFEPQQFDATNDNSGEIEAALSQQVREKKLFAFLLIEPKSSSNGFDLNVSYHTESPTFAELPDWIEGVLNDEVQRERMRRSGLDEKTFRRVSQRINVQQKGLAQVSATGQLTKSEETNRFAAFGIPVGAMFLLFMLVMTSVPTLTMSVVEEKGARIAEVLLASVSPFQLMLGKLISAALVSLTLAILYLGGLTFFAWRNDVLSLIPLPMYGWFLFFHMLAMLTFGALALAIGAACSDTRDAQNLSAPLMLLMIIPAFVWLPVFQSPNGPLATLMSLFPPATPMIMLLRIGVKPGPPLWELVVGILLCTAFMVFCVWAAGKTFRVGILSHGQMPTLKKLIEWLRAK